MLRPADDLLIIEALARSLMAEHELDGWRFKWDRAKARAGQCNYRDKTISLSLYYVERYGYMEVRDTILHEIAHALAGPGTGHGWVWKQTCRAIGAAPERLLDGEVSEREWEGLCSSCGGVIMRRHRRCYREGTGVRHGDHYGGILWRKGNGHER